MKTRLVNNPLDKPVAINGAQSLKRLDIKGVKLSEIRYVATSLLRANPLSATFFSDETIGDLQKLVADIAERGILVPLIVKPDGTLLAGHNRLQAAQELGLQRVPVQEYDESHNGTMTDEQERKFVISDNLLRRQLSSDQRMALYRVLYPNFDQRVALRPNATVTVIDAPIDSVNNVHTVAIMPLTARKIADDTGQTTAAVQRQLQRENQKNHASQLAVAQASGNKSIEVAKARQRSIDKDFSFYVTQIEQEFSDPDLTIEFRQKKAKKLRELADRIEKYN